VRRAFRAINLGTWASFDACTFYDHYAVRLGERKEPAGRSFVDMNRSFEL
jgi:hypothetical protein